MSVQIQGVGVDHQTATFIVAASDYEHPEHADYVCDGADDQVVIQATLDSLTSGRWYPEKVVLIGHFWTTAPIKVPEHTILEIQGELKLADNSNCDIIQTTTLTDEYTDIHITGGVINGNKANNLTGGNGIKGVFKQSTISNTLFHSCREWGVNLHSVDTAHRTWETSIKDAFFNINEGHVQFAPHSCDNVAMGNVMSQATNTAVLDDAGYNFLSHNHMWNAEILVECRSSGHMIYNNYFDGCSKEAIKFAPSTGWKDVSMINNNRFYECCNLTNNTYSVISFAPVGGVGILNTSIIGNSFFSLHANKPKHAIDESLGGKYSIISGNQFTDIISAAVVPGTESQIRNNWGFVTENSGTQTLGAAETSMNVPHGLAVTPTDGDIMVIAAGDMLNTNKMRIGNYDAINFTLYADVAPGGAGTLYAFKAIVL